MRHVDRCISFQRKLNHIREDTVDLEDDSATQDDISSTVADMTNNPETAREIEDNLRDKKEEEEKRDSQLARDMDPHFRDIKRDMDKITGNRKRENGRSVDDMLNNIDKQLNTMRAIKALRDENDEDNI